MENALQVFTHEEFGEIRTQGDWENPKFCLPDICRALDLRVDNVVKSLKDDPYTTGGISLHPITDSLGRTQLVNFVDEPCLYRVIFTSRKPNALKFQDWIFRVVIPSLRKTGTYSVSGEPRSYSTVPLVLPAEMKFTPKERKIVDSAIMPKLSKDEQLLINKLLENATRLETFMYLAPIDLPGEIWKDIKGYGGDYQVSTKGRVRSLKFGKVAILRPLHDNKGYLRVRLNKNGVGRNLRISRLVATAFIPNPHNLPMVHHKDDNKLNNDVTNLEWTTNEKNLGYAAASGAFRKKLTPEQVIEIFTTHIKGDENFNAMALARKFGVSYSTVKEIIRGKIWKHVTQALTK